MRSPASRRRAHSAASTKFNARPPAVSFSVNSLASTGWAEASIQSSSGTEA